MSFIIGFIYEADFYEVPEKIRLPSEKGIYVQVSILARNQKKKCFSTLGQAMVGERLNQLDSSAGTIEAMKSLQSSNDEAVKVQRKHTRFAIRSKVIIQPSNCVDRGSDQWLGECHDISKGGCRLLTQRPLQLGSIYWVQFQPTEDLKLDPVFARCVRGQLMRENAFEFGFSFLTPIELPEPEAVEESETILP